MNRSIVVLWVITLVALVIGFMLWAPWAAPEKLSVDVRFPQLDEMKQTLEERQSTLEQRQRKLDTIERVRKMYEDKYHEPYPLTREEHMR